MFPPPICAQIDCKCCATSQTKNNIKGKNTQNSFQIKGIIKQYLIMNPKLGLVFVLLSNNILLYTKYLACLMGYTVNIPSKHPYQSWLSCWLVDWAVVWWRDVFCCLVGWLVSLVIDWLERCDVQIATYSSDWGPIDLWNIKFLLSAHLI